MLGWHTAPPRYSSASDLEPIFPFAGPKDNHALHRCEFIAEKAPEKHFRSAFVFGGSIGIEHHIALDADLFNQIELALEKIDMFLLAPQYS